MVIRALKSTTTLTLSCTSDNKNVEIQNSNKQPFPPLTTRPSVTGNVKTSVGLKLRTRPLLLQQTPGDTFLHFDFGTIRKCSLINNLNCIG